MKSSLSPDEFSREHCRDAIERFLDRSWLMDRIPAESLGVHRAALGLLDDWMSRNREVPLTGASAADVRELLRSTRWDTVARRCEALLGLTMRFYQNLRESRFRADDPFDTLIDQELAAAAAARHAVRRRGETGTRTFEFHHSPVA